MSISFEHLNSMFELLLERMKEAYPDEKIEIKYEDYYWEVSKDQKYDPTKKPDDFCLGQVSSDWSDLLKLLETAPDERLPISYHLQCMAEILNVIVKNSHGIW